MDEEKKDTVSSETPKRGCLACSVGVTLAAYGNALPPSMAGWETILATAVCDHDGVEVVKQSLCPGHSLMFERARTMTRQTHEERMATAAAAPVGVLSGESLAAFINSVAPGHRNVGTCGNCKLTAVVERNAAGVLTLGHEDPMCEGFKSLIDATEAAGLSYRTSEGIMNLRTGQMMAVPTGEQPS